MKKTLHENAENSVSDLLDFDIFWVGHASRNPLIYASYITKVCMGTNLKWREKVYYAPQLARLNVSLLRDQKENTSEIDDPKFIT